HEINPQRHVEMQAAFQKHVDNSISKTINLPHSATVQDVKDVYWQAWKQKCKGITIYRDGSRDMQVLSSGDRKVDKDTQVIQTKVRITPLQQRTYTIPE
ncbi:ribonucleotide-diphosphate reductase subunit alpha, partial [candidate division WWE3 bacterium]|nr:ribonucleotide-diphosphate reductase subunit alpha [candidate division WWE3 bacterium]